MLIKRWIFFGPFIFLFFVIATDVCSQEQSQTVHGKNAFDIEREKILNQIKQRWSDQIERLGDVGDTTTLDLSGKDGGVVIHGGFQTTSIRNPMVSEKCRAESLARAVLNLQHEEDLSPEQAFEEAEGHLRSKQNEFRKGITFTKWIKHVAACKKFCNVAVLKLLQCHVESVSKHPHDIVLFDFDSYTVKPEFDSKNISEFADEILNDSSKRILLLARASQAGTASKQYNRELSLLRGNAVQSVLLSKRVPQDKIKVQHLGNEEPQLNEWIAQIYGMRDIYKRVGGYAINQSVLMVVY